MSEIITFEADEIAPDRDAVFADQGIPAGRAVSRQVEGACAQALEVLAAVAAPAGILAETAQRDFAAIYQGQGRNEAETPVGDIFGRAEHLALFAVTLGAGICREIAARFASNDLAVAAMLDSVASVAADRAAAAAERRFLDDLTGSGRCGPGTCALRYSPGYCGWHISGQMRLFELLRPGRIGISLRDSFLMEPLKSVSGVIIVGPAEIHEFTDAYPFCGECRTRGCRERLRTLQAG